VTTPRSELDQLFDASVGPLVEGIGDMVKAEIEGRAQPLEQFAALLRKTQGLADMLGRRRVILELESQGIRQFAAAPEVSPLLATVPFVQALLDLTERQPVLAASASVVARVYSVERGFALARAVSETVAQRVRDRIVADRRAGRAPAETIELIAELGPFTRAYAQTVYRTNLSTAYSAGRFRQAADPDIYMAVVDSDVRRGRKEDQGENHKALHRFMAPTDWDGWGQWAPPGGYQCRCSLRLVTNFELSRKGIKLPTSIQVPERAAFHSNFQQGRPDHQIYFGS